jgi:hypothetical protein
MAGCLLLAWWFAIAKSSYVMLRCSSWIEDAWGDAVLIAINETGMDSFPESCPWAIENILPEDWLQPPMETIHEKNA